MCNFWFPTFEKYNISIVIGFGCNIFDMKSDLQDELSTEFCTFATIFNQPINEISNPYTF